MRFAAVTLALLVAGAAFTGAAVGQTAAPPGPDTTRGEAIFKARCQACHEPPVDGALTRRQLAAKTPDEIVTALSTGPMAPVADDLTPDEMHAVAAYLTAAP